MFVTDISRKHIECTDQNPVSQGRHTNAGRPARRGPHAAPEANQFPWHIMHEDLDEEAPQHSQNDGCLRRQRLTVDDLTVITSR
jgi:hypothetical protein